MHIMSGIQRRCFKTGKGVRRKSAFILPTNEFMGPKVFHVPSTSEKFHSHSYCQCRELLTKILRVCLKEPPLVPYGMVYLLSYVFLLRMPSEALPVRAVHGEFRLQKEGEFLALHLARRKNKPGGSQLLRGCWCTQCKITCPVHVLGPWLNATAAGELLFPGVTAASALRTLRAILMKLSIPDAGEYRTHDLRRGHAKDLQLSG